MPIGAALRQHILHHAPDAAALQRLLAAAECGVFDELARGPRTAGQLRRRLSPADIVTPELLDWLVSLGWLVRDGDDAEAVYLNARELTAVYRAPW